MDALTPYRRVWAVDFEFTAPPGERPIPLCCVAREVRTGELVRLWLADASPVSPPYDTGPDTLSIAYYASAEWGCHLALDWPLPRRILDLFAEFKCLTSGIPVPCGNGLLGALACYGLDGLARLRSGWDRIKRRLAAEVDRDYGVFVPTGQRLINPATATGAAILSEAEAWGIDAHRLADAVDVVWAEERKVNEETFAARRAARRATGLTARRIDQWENIGQDYSSYPGLDVKARGLAGTFPALGIGSGLVEGPADEIEDVVARTQAAMREASELVLPGFPLRTDAKIVRYPDRYMDDRGWRMWETVSGLLGELSSAEADVSPVILPS